MHPNDNSNRTITMNKSINKLFKELGDSEPRDSLAAKILLEISRDRERSARRKMFFSRLGMAASLIGMVYAVAVYGNALVVSEFWSLASLAYYDAGILWSHWNSFVYSLLETFPVVDLIALLLPIFTLCLSLSTYSKSLNLKYRHGY